ncbi:sporulation protein [Streptomyces durbertensis]|uniref:Sporulation protein n=1 Tax=Streptomyces durbertensis TaxID=2448886 RepID=A0ABR6EKA7_9ACTN|nr:sporulation protein [Streptomyces durbertensis]MBB1245755.1 sporulation protein [Streptomyces durbertensis]
MRRESNRALAAVIAEAGVSNKGLARRVQDVARRRGVHVGTTHVAVQRWLSGSGIQPRTGVFLAEALSEKLGRRVTPADLGLPGSIGNGPDGGTSYAASLPGALKVMEGLTRFGPEGGASDDLLLPEGEINSAVLSWLVSRPDGLIASSTLTRRVTMRDVAALRTAGEMFMHLDFRFGGGHGHRPLRHYFREDVLPLLNAGYTDKVGRALFGAAAEISQLLAWTAYDTGNHALADRYLVATLRLTQVVDDRLMGARILTNMSHQANYLGQVSRAVRLARASVEGGKGRATPRAMALFTAHEARALSTAGDAPGATRAMREAERHFARACTGEDPDWLAYMDEAELAGEFCHCFRDLGQGREAVRFAERAVELTDPKYARTLGLCRIVLAQSQLLNGELEVAVATAGVAVRDGDALQSSRFQRYVTDFQRSVARHEGEPAVRRFNEQVREAVAGLDEE